MSMMVWCLFGAVRQRITDCNALDRARLRQANRLFAKNGLQLSRDELMTIEGADLRASRVFS